MFLLLHHCEVAEPADEAVDIVEVEAEAEAADADEDEDDENEAILVVVVVVAVATRELAEPIARRSSCCVVDIDACKLRRI